MRKVELLAPAGDMDTLKIAIEAGADAVYLAGKNFGARYYARNFEDEDLKEAIFFAHTRGVKVYVTINTIVYQSEWEKLVNYLDYLYQINIDAIIVQDIGVIYYVRNKYPDMEIHASTQMNIYNEEGLDELIKLGVKRVVMAREVSLEQVKKFVDKKIEIEVFIHGALCFCASGNCLMSYSIGKRSGNRGKCAQPCRKNYTLYENNQKITQNKSLMSMKDLCTIGNINELIASNITSFKIEGRMKSPEYIYVVVKAYRKAIDKYYSKLSRETISIDDEITRMKTVYNRKFTKGYVLKEKNALLTNIDTVNHQGIVIGKIMKYTHNAIEIKLSSNLDIHDAIRIHSPQNIGFYVQKIFVNGTERKSANVGEIAKIPISLTYCLGKEVLKTKSNSIHLELKKFLQKEQLKIPLIGEFVLKMGYKATLRLNDCKHIIEVSTEEILVNHNNTLRDDTFYYDHLNKLGDTPFYFQHLSIQNDQKTYISLKDLNKLRKDGIDKLIEKRNKIEQKEKILLKLNERNYLKQSTTIEAIVHTPEQYDICKKYGIKTIYTDYSSNKMVASRMGHNIRNCEMIHNIGQIKEGNVASPYFNIVNVQAIELIKNLGIGKIYLSYELPLTEIKLLNLNKIPVNVGIPIYGKMDLMIFMHCMIAKAKGYDGKYCKQCFHNNYYLEDEFHNKFTIFPNPSKNCDLRLIDHKAIDLIRNVMLLKNLGINLFLLTFTTETSNDVENILKKLILNLEEF